MKRPLKRKPSDYPQFTFRIDQETKEKLLSEVDAVRAMYERGLAEDERSLNKNEILIMALEIGLERLKSKYRKQV